MTKSQYLGLLIILLVINLLVALWNAVDPVHRGTMLVLTPMIDVVPSALALSREERLRLDEEFAQYSRAVESRDVAHAFAVLGSTLSIHDLVRGIALIEDSPQPLSPQQRELTQRKLQRLLPAHRQVLSTQQQLIELEDQISAELKRLGVP